MTPHGKSGVDDELSFEAMDGRPSPRTESKRTMEERGETSGEKWKQKEQARHESGKGKGKARNGEGRDLIGSER